MELRMTWQSNAWRGSMPFWMALPSVYKHMTVGEYLSLTEEWYEMLEEDMEDRLTYWNSFAQDFVQLYQLRAQAQTSNQ